MRCSLLACFVLSAAGGIAHGENWPAWRGPHGNGHSADGRFPVRWSATQNVRWKLALPGPGNSTPVVWGDRVFVSCASQEGRIRNLLCIDHRQGRLVWQRSVEYSEKEPTHKTNPYCSSSPVTDGQLVIVWHGSAGVHAYDFEGRKRWSRDLGKFDHIWGNASSPVIYRDLVILNCGPGLRSFMIALNKQTGREVWRKTLPDAVSKKINEFHGSWSTPVVAGGNGRDVLIVSLPRRLYAMNPLTGEVVWSCDGLGELVYTSPLVTDEVVVAMSGFHGPAMAVRRGGTGDVTRTHRMWLHEPKTPQRVGSGVIVGPYIFILNERGVAWCMELKTGEILWKQKLGKKGSWSSMSYADGRLYVSDMEGTTYVLKAEASECAVLAENRLGELIRASLAFSDGRIFARTYQHLYCLEAPPGDTGRPSGEAKTD